MPSPKRTNQIRFPHNVLAYSIRKQQEDKSSEYLIDKKKEEEEKLRLTEGAKLCPLIKSQSHSYPQTPTEWIEVGDGFALLLATMQPCFIVLFRDGWGEVDGWWIWVLGFGDGMEWDGMGWDVNGGLCVFCLPACLLTCYFLASSLLVWFLRDAEEELQGWKTRMWRAGWICDALGKCWRQKWQGSLWEKFLFFSFALGSGFGWVACNGKGNGVWNTEWSVRLYMTSVKIRLGWFRFLSIAESCLLVCLFAWIA